MIIQVCGPVGFETALKLYRENEGSAKARFPGYFLDSFESIDKEKVSLDELKTYCLKDQTLRCFPLEEGGLFGALWKLGEECGTGMEINLESIPVRQEVIEIMELFGDSPYECSSAGSYAVVSERGVCSDSQICFTTIGHTTSSRKRIIRSVWGDRYLTPPSRQEKDIADRTGSRCIN